MAWWDDTFYPLLHAKWSNLAQTLGKFLSDKINTETIEYVKSVIIDVGSVVEDVKTTRNVLFGFLKNKMRSILGTVCNMKKLAREVNDEISLRQDPLYSIIVSVTNNKNYEQVLRQTREVLTMMSGVDALYFTNENDVTNDVIVKNVSLLAYILVEACLFILTQGSGNKTTMIEQDNMKISCMIVYYILEKMASSLENTLVDSTKLKKAVEELRERRKQELIASYKVDDEERQLQITLKNMGLDNWADILTGNDDEKNEPSIQNTMSQKDEYDMAKDEIYATFKGEHDDFYGDDEDDEDVMVSYEAYDY